MAEHPNEKRMRRLYELGSSGSTDWAADALADDIVWHVPGRGANAGAHRGKEEVLAFFRRVIPGLESFKIEVHEVCHFDDEGKVSAFWALIDDTSAFDEFFA